MKQKMEKPKRALAAYYSLAEAESLVGTEFKCLHGNGHAPNVFHELFMLYRDALGEPQEWTGCYSEAGKVVLREKHKPVSQKDAAEGLAKLVLDGVHLVGLLSDNKRELCREVARTLAEWPVTADLTERSWQRTAEQLVQDLSLGSAIKGFIRSARTGKENPIRRYATAIYQALLQTRWRFKEADGTSQTREGCPPWAAKTLTLPRFTKDNVRAWTALGKEMLLEQRPGFLDDEALKEQKFKWTRRAENRSSTRKVTQRAIQNEAFDDFTKELRKLTPAEDVYRGEW